VFDNVTMSECVTKIIEMTRQRDRARYVCTGNLDHLVLLDRDPEFLETYRSADLVVADGAPVVWLSRLFPPRGGAPLKERVAGSDLFWELARASAEHGVRLFLLGGAPGAADGAVAAICRRYPNAQICGTYCPPFETFATREEQGRIQEVIRQAKPDILMVAFGAPKQEKWILANKDALQVPIAIGVGGSFEMASGIVRRAPRWMQKTGLEWSYRFLQEPGRLWKRYFAKDLPFLTVLIGRTLLARLRKQSYAPETL
jgi:N-acetylglucosaminyldiphosphoundecaprenol N-acetyl-beta-D-mannosaminyltransferase